MATYLLLKNIEGIVVMIVGKGMVPPALDFPQPP